MLTINNLDTTAIKESTYLDRWHLKPTTEVPKDSIHADAESVTVFSPEPRVIDYAWVMI